MKKTIGLLVLIVVGFMLTACNTVNGFGKDVEKVGEKMQNASNKKKTD